jgi:hypothetical protein
MAETSTKTVVKLTREKKKAQKDALRSMKFLLVHALAPNNYNASNALPGAVSVFSTLNAKNQEKALKTISRQLGSCASRSGFRQTLPSKLEVSFRGASLLPAMQEDVRTASVLTGFLTGIAKAMPRNGSDDIIVTKPLQRIYSSLAKIAGSLPYTSESHAAARKAASNALWQLDYDYTPFWEARLEDQTTRGDTITKLLVVEPDAGKNTGWDLLKSHLGDYYADIARNAFPHVHDFLTDAINDTNDGVQCNAFRAAAYLPVVPESLFMVAQRMQLPREDAAAKMAADMKAQANPTFVAPTGPTPIKYSHEVKQAARDFLFVNQARQMIGAGEEYAGTFALTILYMNGSVWLRPMLEEMCAEATSRAKIESGLAEITGDFRPATGALTDGSAQTAVPARTLLGILGMAGIKVPAGVLASKGVHISQEIGQTAWDIIDLLPALNTDHKTGDYAQDENAPVRGACLRVFGRTSGDKRKVRFNPAEETRLVTDLITLHSALGDNQTRQAEVESLLQVIGMKMADVVVNPSSSTLEAKTEARQKARDTLGLITKAGIYVPYSDFLDDSIAFTTDSAQPIPADVIRMAASATAVNSVFVASIYFGSVPTEVLDFARRVSASAFDNATKQMAADVVFINEAKEMRKQEAPAAFAGTLALAMLYSAERPALTRMIGGMLADALNAPAGNAESASTLRIMHASGIQPALTRDDKTIGVPIPNPFKQLPRDIITHAIDMPPPLCALYAGAFLSRTPAELTEYAKSLASDTKSPTSIAAKDFLAITEATGLINCGDDNKQGKGVHALIKLYKDRKDLAPLLFEAGMEMADLVMNPPCGEPAQRYLGWNLLCRIEEAGIGLTYQKLLAAPYLDEIPGTVIALAEALLVQEHINEAVKLAARDLLVIRDAKATLATTNPVLYTLTLSTLYHTGSNHVKDLVESTGNDVVLELVTTTDTMARQKALRILGSLYDIGVSGAAFFAEALRDEIRPEMLACAKDLANGNYPPGLKMAAEDIIAVNEARKNLADADMQFEGAHALIDLYDAGRTSLTNLLYDKVAKQMAPLLAPTATPEQQDAAAGIISLLYERKSERIEWGIVSAGKAALKELAGNGEHAAAAGHALAHVKKMLGAEKFNTLVPGVDEIILPLSVLIEDRNVLGKPGTVEVQVTDASGHQIQGGVSDAA